jgi:hypothetical protein
MGGLEPNRNRVIVPARQATQPGGIGTLEPVLRLLKFKNSGALLARRMPVKEKEKQREERLKRGRQTLAELKFLKSLWGLGTE